MLLALGGLLEHMVFEIGSYRGVSDCEIYDRPVRWLFDASEHVARNRWTEYVAMVSATETALQRTIALAFTKKGQTPKLPPLPTWDELSGNKKRETRKSGFITRMEKALHERRERLAQEAMEHGGSSRNDPS